MTNSLQQISVEQCPDPAPLPDVTALPLETIQPPALPVFPQIDIPGFWWAESLFLLLPALVFAYYFFTGGTWSFNHVSTSKPQKSSKVLVGRITPAYPTPIWVLWVVIGLCLLLGINHGIQNYRVARALDLAENAFQQKAFDESKSHLSAAHSPRYWTPVSFFGIVGYRQAMARPRLEDMREVVNTSRLIEAIEAQSPSGTADALEALTPWKDANYAETRSAAVAGNTYLARHRLISGNTGEALTLVEKAGRIDPKRVNPLLCRARYHHAAASIMNGAADSITPLLQELDMDECDLTDDTRVLLRIHYARERSAKMIDPQVGKGDSGKVLQLYRNAYEYSAVKDHPHDVVTCDLAGALGIHAVALTTHNQFSRAVAILDESDQLIPDQKFVREFRPKTLLMWGYRELQQGRYRKSIDILERARKESRDPQITQALTSAWQAKGLAALEESQYETAVHDLKQAVKLSPHVPAIRKHLGEVYVKRGEVSLKTGDLNKARRDYNEASRTSGEHRQIARMILNSLGRGEQRMREINRAPSWLEVPGVKSFVPKDADRDGKVDYFAFYNGNAEHPIMVGRPQSTGEIRLTDRDGNVTRIIRDQDRNGDYSERVDYNAGVIDALAVDVDRDRRPDVLRDYQGTESFIEKPLSGNIVLVMKSGVVGEETDPFNEPDLYIKFFMNGEYLGRTDHDQDTYYPIWNQGYVMNYRFGDRIQLQAWDADLIYDDFIDRIDIGRYPEKGVYTFNLKRVAVNVDVRPSRLKDGHFIRDEVSGVSENIFRDYPASTPEASLIIAGAEASQEMTNIKRETAKWVALNVLIPAVLPTRSVVGVLMRDYVAEATMEAFLPTPE
ncbi:MAG: hypothetical protein QNK37_02155 [Acidobacteriota bacterium]|nr:hypothetical protein [Acidobacteriota bacterium]